MRHVNGLGEFYSRTFGKDGEICELFIDLVGNPTTEYPHVHIIHHGNGKVDIVAKLSRQEEIWRTSFRNPNGNQVNDAKKTAIVKLRLERVKRRQK